MSQVDAAVQSIDEFDPHLRDFIFDKVNSFVKWDLIRYFHGSPQTADTAENIALATGRDPQDIVTALNELSEAGILEAQPLADSVAFTFRDDNEIRQMVNSFILACDDRQFRVKAIYYVIRQMRQL
jgi:hypothetical protein